MIPIDLNEYKSKLSYSSWRPWAEAARTLFAKQREAEAMERARGRLADAVAGADAAELVAIARVFGLEPSELGRK